MKTTIITLIALLFIGVNVNASIKHDPSILKAQKSSVAKEVTLKVEYPNDAIEEDVQGSVYVSFTLEEDGSIVIDKIHSTQTILKEHVITELEKIKVNQNLEYSDVKYEVKLSFKLN